MRPLDATEHEGNLQGLLLAAHPSLRDPNFRRSVLLLSAHQADAGASGLIINRPLGRTAAELLPDHGHQELLEKVPVFLGGPVAPDQLSFVDLRWDENEGSVQFHQNLSFAEVEKRTEEAPGSVRAFVGYAGWAAGQLESELEQKAWVLVKPQAQTVQPDRNRLWFDIMNALGPEYKLLAAIPDDPTLN
jgi:putative transcriptional regulator